MIVHPFAQKIDRFRWLDLDGAHGTLSVWQQDGVRLVLFAEDGTERIYVLSEEDLREERADALAGQPV